MTDCKAWRLVRLGFLIIRAWLFNNLLVIDYQVNAIFGGSPGETISSRLGKGQLKDQPVHSVLATFVDLLFKLLFNQSRHCYHAIQHDEGQGAISDVIDRYKAGEKQIWGMD